VPDAPTPSRSRAGVLAGVTAEDAVLSLPPMARVLGVNVAGRQVAFPYEQLAAKAVEGFATVHRRIGGRRIVVFWKQGTASAVDQPKIAASRDVGSATAYVPRWGGRVLHFEATQGGSSTTRPQAGGTSWGGPSRDPWRGRSSRRCPP
jgi:uncharacterized protein DUF3179